MSIPATNLSTDKMSLKCGIVGLPNAGKSSIFNALTDSSKAEMGNYPFCTIEANKGLALIPDLRLQQIRHIIQPAKTIPTGFEFVDIAGLIKGASKGEGLGNRFLSHIREVNSILHLVRGFKDKGVSHVYGEPDPVRDIEIVNTELILADLEIAEKRLKKQEKTAQSTGDKKLKQECELLRKALAWMEKGKSLREGEWTVQERKLLKPFQFISLKPVLYICNLKEEELLPEKAELRSQLKEQFSSLSGEDLMFVSCAMEAEMAGWLDEEKTAFLKTFGFKEPVLNRLIRKVYQQLGLISFFTAGVKELRAWTIPKGALAPAAGGVIHSDFEKGFIRAELYSCEELFKYKSEKALREKGLLRSVGKDYEVRDGDVLHFLFKV